MDAECNDAVKAVPRRSRVSQCGAVAVEGAIGGLVFFAILMAVVEFGMTFFDYLTATSASRNGARLGATVGNDPLADYKILQKIRSSSVGMPLSGIQSIIVYKASASSSDVPASCLAGPVNNVCNRYASSDLSRPSTDFGCGGSAPDRFWCPTTRLVGASAGGTPVSGPPDYFGIYIQAQHPTLTKMYTSDYSYDTKFVLRLEAQTP